jgi:putative membrane protein
MAVAGAVALAIALTAVAGQAGFASHPGPSAAASTDLGDLWAVPPVETAGALLLSVLYALRVHRVGGVSRLRQLSFHSGVAVVLLAVCSPLGGVAQQGLLTAHMLQHTLIGAVAPLLLLLGLTRGFVTGMLAPRAVRVLGRLQHPALSYPLWALSTLVWLVPGIHHEVLVNPALWVLQQLSFLVFGVLLWAPVVEVLPAPSWFGTGWKGSYMTGVWTLGLIIANVYWFSGTAFYDSHASAAAAWGLEPLEDQANAGTVMMVLHCLLAFGAITILFFRQAREGELSQRLIEAGIDPDRVAEAIRGGRGAALARSHGLSAKTRAGID